MKMALCVGGDTDTNGCIVGYIIGTFVGFKNIPKPMIGKVLSFDCTKDIIKRDILLSTKFNTLPLLDRLLTKMGEPFDQLEILNDFIVKKIPAKRLSTTVEKLQQEDVPKKD